MSLQSLENIFKISFGNVLKTSLSSILTCCLKRFILFMQLIILKNIYW